MKRDGKSIHALDGDIIIIRQGLAIYKTFATPFYQVRIRDTVAGKYIVRSTKETARIKARVAAEELARDMLGKIPAVPKHLSFEHYAKLYIQQTRLEVERSEKARSAIGNAIAPIENKQWGLIKYFGRRNIKEIASYDYTSYVRWFIEKRPDIAPSSIARTTSVFRSILRVALLDGVIHSIPETPKLVSSKPAARTFFRFHPLVSREKDDVVRMLTRVGLAPEILEAIRTRRIPPFSHERQKLIYEMTNELLDTKKVSDGTYMRAEQEFGVDLVLEIVTAVGFYTLICMTIKTFEVPAPSDATQLD